MKLRILKRCKVDKLYLPDDEVIFKDNIADELIEKRLAAVIEKGKSKAKPVEKLEE